MMMDIDIVGQMLEEKGLSHAEIDIWFEHHGVKGQKWGVRRNPTTGVRPIARTLNDSAFGRLSKANMDRHNAAKSRKTARKKGTPLPGDHHDRNVKIALAGAAAVGTVLAIHGARKMSDRRVTKSMERFAREGVATWYNGSTPFFMRDING